MNIIQSITDFIFLQNEPCQADVIFIPGNGHAEPSERAAALYRAGFAPLCLPSGRYAKGKEGFSGQVSGARRYPGDFATEWGFMQAVLTANGVPTSAILQEDAATFTYQNAILSRQVCERNGLQVRKALLCCMPVHARRAWMYYSLLFPEAELFICPAVGTALSRENWFQTPEGIDAVLGEVARCGEQFHDIFKEKLLEAPQAFPSRLEKMIGLPETHESSF